MDRLQAIAAQLWRARQTGRPIPPLDAEGLTADDAYAVQRINHARTDAAVIGRKVGLTSEAIQRQLNVDEPDYGVLRAGMNVSDAPIDARALMQPRIEAEVAFVLAGALGADADLAAARAAVAYAVVAAEIVASAIDGWRIGLFDTVADNASAGVFALGSQRLTLDAFEPRDVIMTMRQNGETVSTGTGAACMGDPLAALVWLARQAARLGEPLQAGEVILSGALGPMAWVRPGDVFEIEVLPFGALQVAFGA